MLLPTPSFPVTFSSLLLSLPLSTYTTVKDWGRVYQARLPVFPASLGPLECKTPSPLHPGHQHPHERTITGETPDGTHASL